LTKAVREVQAHPRFRSVPINLDCDEEIHGWYDARKLERAFFNLILNACEAVPKNNGQIEIQVQQEDGHVYIRITDNGPGVPSQIQNKLFQPFVSAGKLNGSGLGLAIVQKCCVDHRGSVDVEVSSPGRTTFRITLPVEPSKTSSNEKSGNSSVLTGAVHGS
jgi:signal transduction histidine kinase